MNRSLYEIIDAAQELLKRGWVSGHLAIDKDGKPVNPEDEAAVAYCQIGALAAIAHYETTQREKLVDYCNAVINMANTGMVNYNSIPQRNDTHAKEDAISVFERGKQYVAKHFGVHYVPNWLVADRELVGAKTKREHP